MFVTCHITLGQLSNFVGGSLEVSRTTILFNYSDIFLKYFNSNHNLPSYSLFSKCFWWFFYLGVHKGTGVFFFHSSSRAWLALAPASRLPPFDRKRLKNYACSADPGLLNETKGSCFPLSCLSSYQNKWSKQTFFYNDINI